MKEGQEYRNGKERNKEKGRIREYFRHESNKNLEMKRDKGRDWKK